MEFSFENIVIGGLFLGAVAWAVRGAWRSVKHTGGCSSCSSAEGCPLSQDPITLSDLPPGGCAATPPAKADEPVKLDTR